MIARGGRLLAALLAATLVGYIFLRAAAPLAGGGIPEPWDKIAHLCGYGTIAGLLIIALVARARWWVFGFTVLIGALDELNQSRFPGRVADPVDLAADALGALLAVTIYRTLVCRRLGLAHY